MKIKHTLPTYFIFKEKLCGWTRHPYDKQEASRDDDTRNGKSQINEEE